MQSLEDQQIEQSLQQRAEFESWFGSCEVQWNFVEAVKLLSPEQIASVIDLDLLEQAYFYKTPPAPNQTASDIYQDDDGLPF